MFRGSDWMSWLKSEEGPGAPCTWLWSVSNSNEISCCHIVLSQRHAPGPWQPFLFSVCRVRVLSQSPPRCNNPIVEGRKTSSWSMDCTVKSLQYHSVTNHAILSVYWSWHYSCSYFNMGIPISSITLYANIVVIGYWLGLVQSDVALATRASEG